jgi:hypothetical protein
MKKLFFTVVLALGLLTAPMAMADTVTFTGGSGYGPYQTGLGGEFTVTPDAGLSWVLKYYVSGTTSNVQSLAGTFQTFCVEGAETVSGYGTYSVILNTNAVYGGVGPIGDPLSVGAAWLYAQFAAGTLAIYDYTNPGRSGSGNSADLLQKAIWWLEGEEGIIYNASNPFMLAVVNQFGSQAAAMSDNNNLFSVMVMNLYAEGHAGDPNYRRQDILVRVPEPGILILLGIAMSAIGAASWRIRKL